MIIYPDFESMSIEQYYKFMKRDRHLDFEEDVAQKPDESNLSLILASLPIVAHFLLCSLQ